MARVSGEVVPFPSSRSQRTRGAETRTGETDGGRQRATGCAREESFLLFFSCPVVAGGIASWPPPRLLRLTVTRTENTDGNGRRVAGVRVPAFQPVGQWRTCAQIVEKNTSIDEEIYWSVQPNCRKESLWTWRFSALDGDTWRNRCFGNQHQRESENKTC